MKWLMNACAAIALLFVAAACTPERADFLTDEEYQAELNKIHEQRKLAVTIAIDRIDSFNAMGIDPIQLEDWQLLAVDSACTIVTVFGASVGVPADVVQNAAAACGPIIKALGRGEMTPDDPVAEVEADAAAAAIVAE